MSYKTVDGNGETFKAVKADISYEPYDKILEIVPNSIMIVKGKRIWVFFDYDKPLNVLKKIRQISQCA